MGGIPEGGGGNYVSTPYGGRGIIGRSPQVS